ncbi:hypothetical protein GCM10012275_36330 [Longimycelium tulufanense]|uniref:Ketoreductase domain-containing protein n=1 Tax=Longimycelium tulufanense TaxID=907463 RepID=A0A8J3CGG4_9PSEU|nr:SDR family NAD(P)-dependent oxidoreductase [Longimycelium tulufanense]GGM62331.1 hypothetical protein GCM10012275_36330 [Longimycelium tulufanense]
MRTLPVSVFLPVWEQVHPVGREVPVSWFVLGDGSWLQAALRAGGDGRGDTGVAISLGTWLRRSDPQLLLDGVHLAERAGGRLALLHRGAGGGSLLRAAAWENPQLSMVHVELPSRPSNAAVQTARRLLDRRGVSGEFRVAPDGTAYQRAWRRISLPAAPSALGAGSVLVTGGLGGLGLRVAAVLRHAFGLHPVLVDNRRQSELPGAGARHLERLLGSGIGATVITADLTNRRETVRRLARHGSGVRVLVHCAGRLTGAPVRRTSPTELDHLQEVKVEGLRNVLAGVIPERLTHLVAFGSLMAETPHMHMGAYALANEMLRREVLRLAAQLPRCSTVAAQWSLWSGAGLAHQLGVVRQGKRLGMQPIPLRTGMHALTRLLSWPTGPTHAAAPVIVGGEHTLPDGRTRPFARTPAPLQSTADDDDPG